VRSESCLSEYMSNLECYDNELQRLQAERGKMATAIKEMKIERKAKLKFLSSALLFSTILEKYLRRSKAQSAFA